MTLHIHRSQRADRLADALALMLKTPPADVFATELIVVPARGIERWLTQRLSHELGSGTAGGDGICAGVDFLLPWQLTRMVLGAPRWDSWAPDRLVWPLLRVIDEALDQPWLDTLTAHIGRGGTTAQDRHRQGRRFAVARRLAGLFDSYAGYRPSMLQAWAQGADHDGYGATLPPDLQWQPELWRRLGALVSSPDPVTQLTRWQQEMTAGGRDLALPQRVSYFGATRMTARDLQIVSTLSRHREVHLWLPHPSPALWKRLSSELTTGTLDRRRDEGTILLPRNRLLSALGRDSRELELAIGAVELPALLASAEVVASIPVGPSIPAAVDRASAAWRSTGASLLELLQTAIADDRPAHHDDVQVLDPADRSIQVHACHGPIRQVEVLREVIVGLLADDHSLQPRDILVMCPDIDHYAPLIKATFGLGDAVPQAHPGQDLRVSVADRSISRTNPVVAVLQRVLALVDGRASASEILDLANMAPVRRRFGFTSDDVDQLVRWTGQSAVRWGLDSSHRSTFQMESILQGTWRSGLDRLLLGVTMADDGDKWLSVALPVDDVPSSEIDLAGRFGEFLEGITAAAASMAGTHSVARWSRILTGALHDLTDVVQAEQWQLDQVTGLLADIVVEADIYSETTTMTVTDVDQLLGSRLGPRPTRGNFRTGGLTFCTMVPMRSVPQRVICLLGLDDGVFPRAARQDGDDVLARDPVIGERDVRGEDRQLLLDALLAAGDTVVIIYSGSDERTGAERPPAVPVGELLDTLDEIARTAVGTPVRHQILIRHPLQPFDHRNFLAPQPFSFDHSAWLTARVAQDAPLTSENADSAIPLLSGALPPRPHQDVELATMVRLLQHPARGFLEQRLQVREPDQPAEPMDLLPVELDGLQRWDIGNRLLAARTAGRDIATCRQAEYRRGLLPPGPLGSVILNEILSEVEGLVEASATLRQQDQQVLGIIAQVDGGAALTRPIQVRGTLTVTGGCIVTLTYSKLSPLHRLRSWIEMIALTVARPDLSPSGVTIGRGSTGRPQKVTVGPIPPETASTLLHTLVQLHDVALCEPLPMAARTSCAYAAARRDRAEVADAERAAESTWLSGRFPGENSESAHATVWGAEAPLSTLLRTPAIDPLKSPSGAAESTRFGELAMRLWLPLLENEQVQWL